MKQFLETAELAAKQAGYFISQHGRNLGALRVEQKSLNDFVSEVDRGAEKLICEAIQNAYPSHSILGEEYGVSGDEQAEFQWIVDPLDGTTNFLRGIPHYAVSIALQLNKELVVGVVYDPAKDEMFSALKGRGAYLNGQAIKCSAINGTEGGLFATGIPFSGKLLSNVDQFSDAMVTLLKRQTSGIRRLGAAALDLAYVAAGRYDGFWEASLKPWDIAAGVLLVQEAGGIATDFSSDSQYLDSGNIIACSVEAHNTMQDIVSKAYRLA